ncbi:MAG: alpha/beta hydrolase [Chlamydiales bacterium]
MADKLHETKIGGLDAIEVQGDPELGTIVLLHGYGANFQDLIPISRVFRGPRWIFPNGPIQVPISSDYTGRAWFKINIEALQKASEKKEYEKISQALTPELDGAFACVQKFLAALKTPPSKLVLGGFSQGAILATEAALSLPDQIKGLLVLSGTLVHKESWQNLSQKHKGLPFFQSHGRDDHLLPFKMAQDLEQLLQENGLTGRLHPYTGGHEIPFSLLLDLQPFLARLFIPRAKNNASS